jgi:ribosomal protein S18 acetylase RimI-like enzyme
MVVSDESMDYPKDWESPTSATSTVGHQEMGRTIALHSVAILPEFQNRGLGRVLMLSYMQHMNGAGIADRLALIAHDVSVIIPSLGAIVNRF